MTSYSFFSNANFNISILQTLLLITLYPLTLVSTEKDVTCLSLYSLCFGHVTYQIW